MRQGGANSFFRFVLGFSVFIAVSFCVTYAVSTYAIAEEKRQQTAAAFEVLLGNKTLSNASDLWWKFWQE